MKSVLLPFLFALTFTAFGSSSDLIVQKSSADKPFDVHHNITGFCRDLSTDIVNIDVAVHESKLKVKMKMSQNIISGFGYREYYFWVGATPSKKVGYQPYNPHSVAWPDFYATNRVFLSFNGNQFTGQDKTKLAVQNCLESDCSEDAGMILTDEVKYTVNGKFIEFEVPRSVLPLIGSEKNVKFGFTTYYEIAQCNGEDDFPDWDEKSFNINL